MQALNDRLEHGRLAEPRLHACLVPLQAARLGRPQHALHGQRILGARPLALLPRRRLELPRLARVPGLVLCVL